MSTNLLIDGTPFEEYRIGKRTVIIKRDDLCCPDKEAPNLAKLRGLSRLLSHYPVGTSFGVLDAGHSKNGWALAFLGNRLGYPVFDYFPVYAKELEEKGDYSKYSLRPSQENAKNLGATMVGIPAKFGYSAVLYAKARAHFLEANKLGSASCVLLPNAMKYDSSVQAMRREVALHTPGDLLNVDWVLPVGTGTMAKGVIKGLSKRGYSGTVHIVLGYGLNTGNLLKYLEVPSSIRVNVVDNGYGYHDFIEEAEDCPVSSMSGYYERKAWNWAISALRKKTFVLYDYGD